MNFTDHTKIDDQNSPVSPHINPFNLTTSSRMKGHNSPEGFHNKPRRMTFVPNKSNRLNEYLTERDNLRTGMSKDCVPQDVLLTARNEHEIYFKNGERSKDTFIEQDMTLNERDQNALH